MASIPTPITVAAFRPVVAANLLFDNYVMALRVALEANNIELAARIVDATSRLTMADNQWLRLVDQLAAKLFAAGDFEQSAKCCRIVLEQLTRQRGPNHFEIAGVLCNLAKLSVVLEHHNQAERLFRKAIAIMDRHGKVDESLVLRRLNNLAWLKMISGRPDQAERIFRQTLFMHLPTQKPKNSGATPEYSTSPQQSRPAQDLLDRVKLREISTLACDAFSHGCLRNEKPDNQQER